MASLAVAGCAAGDYGPNTSNDSGHGNQDLAAVGDLGVCATVSVTPMTATAPVLLTAVANVETTATATWTLSTAGGLSTPIAPDSSGLRVTYQANDPDTYTFQVTFGAGGPCSGQASAHVYAASAITQSYRLRLTPPASSGLPQQDQIVEVHGGSSQLGTDLALTSGSSLGGVLTGPAGAIAGEVQLFPTSGPPLRVGVGSSGSFSLPVRLEASYRMVLIPQDLGLAPQLLGPTDGSTLVTLGYVVGVGAPITGTFVDTSAAALAGATVALRADVLPSSLGTAAGDGSFTLRATPGTYALEASAAGWPDLSLPGIVVGTGGASLAIAQSSTRYAVTAHVVRADGTTPVAGARVTVRSSPISGAATVDLGGGPVAATGIVHASLLSATDGSIALPPLPGATYDVLVEPPDLGPGATEGRTGSRVLVAGAGEIRLTLAAKTSLTGLVQAFDGSSVAGARVRATPLTGGAAVEVSTSADAAYTLLVDAGVPLSLTVDPPDGASLASVRRQFGAAMGPFGGAAPATVDVMLPKGLRIGGIVRASAPLAGVSIDVLCVACGDPTVLAHTESSVNGGYSVGVPDPGLAVPDAATD